MRRIHQFLLIACIIFACTQKEVAEKIAVGEATNDIATCGTPPSAPEPKEAYVIKPIELIPEALGVFERPIQTKSVKAQDFFNQGFQLRYAFAINEAISSFREAQEEDPDCVMCYWGEAWALGSYINSHMKADKAPLALEAINKALELLDENTAEVDRALIESMQVRYVEDFDYETRRNQDSLYADAMAKVHERFPDDLDVATLYADALFLLEPRAGTREMDNPRLMKIHEALEGVLAKNIEHPGACHLYIHATESTEYPELAESCADYLGSTIPGASHINHMPSHTYNEIGRWGDGVRANLQASQTDQLAKDGGAAIATYPGHNLHMLLYAAAYDGQGAIAMQAGRDFHKLTDDNYQHALTAMRFGRFDDILEMDKPEGGVIEKSLWDFCRGYAHLKNDEPDFARLYLKRVQNTGDTTKARYRFSPGGPVLKVAAKILEGEIAWIEGKYQKALELFKAGVKLEDDLPYSEPEPMPFAVRHWLGALQMELKQYAAAEKTYREEVADHPHNGWSLYGLREAMKVQGKAYAEVEADLLQSWARSDTRITSSRF
ncbi:MAG: hypothetical protein R8G66_29175 [Cytophagales bacterium]|nr:hypothetical protein [Cytophagales bacterium]